MVDDNTNLEEPLLLSQQQQITTTTTRIVDGLPYKTSLLIKSLYFLNALGSSTWGRFSAIYYNIHGLHPQQIGLIEGVRTVIPTFSMLFWGFISDMCHCRKHVWLVTKTTSTFILLLLALPFVYKSYTHIFVVSVLPQVFVTGSVLDAHTLELLGDENKIYYGRYRLYASISWGVGSIIMGYITDHYGFDPNFIIFGILSVTMIVLIATQVPESKKINNNTTTNGNDATTHSSQQPSEQQESQQQQQHFASSLSDENENENGNDGNRSDDDNVNANATSTTIAETSCASSSSSTCTNHHNDATTMVILKRLRELFVLLSRPRVCLFLTEVIIMGAAMATVERLLFLYLVNDLHASTLLCGLSVGINVIFELPIFWHAKYFLKLLGHYDGMFLFAMTCFVIRVFGYTLLTPDSRWYILVLETMHGFTFACFWVVTTDVSKQLISQTADSYWGTAIPSIVQLLYKAVGTSIGSVVGGWMMHHLGSRDMYRVIASIVSVVLVIHLVGSITIRLYNGEMSASLLPNYPQQQEEEREDQEEEEPSSLSIAITTSNANNSNNHDIGNAERE